MKKIILSIAIIIVFSIAHLHKFITTPLSGEFIEQDKTSRDTQAKLMTLTAGEHSYRADVYMSNRHFPKPANIGRRFSTITRPIRP